MNRVIWGDNLPALRAMPIGSVDLIYIDPPFNTGKVQQRTRLRVTRDEDGDRTGFGGLRYRSEVLSRSAWADIFDDYMGFLEPRLVEAHRVLSPTGSLFFHIDYREARYCGLLLDLIFGPDAFLNEIIWAYDYGGRTKKKWPAKHDNILWYAKDPERYTFNYDQIERIPYMAPSLVGPEKAARGKTPTDVWWHTIACGKERTGYPTQKPLALIERIVLASSNPGDHVLDFFAGSGTAGEAAAKHGRRFTMIDNNPDAFAAMRERLAPWPVDYIVADDARVAA